MDPRHPNPADAFDESVFSDPPSLWSPPYHLPLPVPWPFRLLARVRLWNVSVFCIRVSLYIEMQPQKFTTERAKVAFLLSLLSGPALLWACAIWKSQSIIINSFDPFVFFFWNFWEIYGLAVHTWSAPTPRKINCEWLHFVVLHPGSYEWLGWVSPSYCLPSGARFTDLHSNGHLRWQSMIGKFHVASRADFSVHHRMPFWW